MTAAPGDVALRDVVAADLPIFYRHQTDPEATSMAAFPGRDEEAFNLHWARILNDERLVKQTIVVDGDVAGNIVCFELDGQTEVGYWIGREYWGRGIATRALAALLRVVSIRPLFAHVAKHNVASIRVLRKCGFDIAGEEPESLRLRLDD